MRWARKRVFGHYAFDWHHSGWNPDDHSSDVFVERKRHKKAIIIATSMTYVSGTMPVGTMWYATCAANAQSAAPTGTAITPRNSELGNGSASSMLLLGTATVSTVAAGLLRPVWSLLPYLATTAAPVPPQTDEVAGLYHVLPNNTFCITGAPSGGSTPLCIFGMVWEEVPYDAPGKGV